MRTRLRRLALSVGLSGVLLTGYATHQQPQSSAAASKSVTFVTDVGGLNDNGFNHLGALGTATGAKAAHYAYHFIETTSPSDYEKNLTTAAQQSQVVVAVGFSFADALKAVAAKYPKVHFTIIDQNYVPSPKNVLGNLFAPEQSSYLAGILAAGMSKTHTIGFVGGLNVPVIQAFLSGFKAGAKSYDPSVRVITAYTGSFTDQGKGKSIGLQEINGGADIVYPAAGASGLGALAAADQRGVYSIGVDADQHYLHPKTVLTSVVKHVEVAVASAIESDATGHFTSGTRFWTLKNDGVGLAPYYNLSARVPAKVKSAITKARQGIVNGIIKVPTQ